MTGVDRVEYAYARALSQEPIPCYGLVRTAFGYLLIEPQALWDAVKAICDNPIASPTGLSRFAFRLNDAQKRAEAEMRRSASKRSPRFALKRLLKKSLPRNFVYINVGHSNVSRSVADAVKGAGGRLTYLVHDVIPLEHPEFQRDGTVARFEQKMRTIASTADLVLYNSSDTKARTERIFSEWGPIPDGEAVHLGTEPFAESPPEDLIHLDLSEPFFAVVGTIEPRKNIGFLLDLWREMGPEAPKLVLCGARGWKNETVFSQLDALEAGSRIVETGPVSDQIMSAIVRNARALLFPSLAEGFGLPAIEAVKLGTPVLCNTLDIFEELLGDIPIYASVKEPYLWIKHIKQLTSAAPEAGTKADLKSFTWEEHFKTVLSLT